jgi:alkylation response protein AidB-like acyl-CoA dehydrogenase
MYFRLTDEQRDIQRMTRDFAQERIAPYSAGWDRECVFPQPLMAELGGLGLMGACVPEEYGGAGADFLSYILVLEELSRADAGVGVTVAVHTSCATLPILSFGTEAQKRHWVPVLASGTVIGAYGLTEPESGSDAAALLTSARRDGDDYILNGRKQFITNAGYSRVIVLFARTAPGTRGSESVAAFLVDMSLPGVTIGKEEEKLGLHSSSTCNVVLEDVRVPAAALLGDEGEGFAIAMHTLDGGRIGIAAQAIGITQAALDLALSYAKERTQFGRRLADFQSTQWKLADMDKDLEAARLLTYKAAWLKMEGRPYGVAGARAKLFASEMARRHTAEAVQILGGYGYTKEFPAERYYRDAKITEIYEGTSEIQRMIISRALIGKGPRVSRV